MSARPGPATTVARELAALRRRGADTAPGAGGAGDHGRVPEVSVIVPVYNSMPYLVTCLASVMEQTLGRARLEVIAVDDGSDDGSGEQLDLLAPRWPALRVAHIEPSGGPSRPRNVGLQMASGRYVFFLDADDYLGPEALERMVVQADRLGSDMVTCRRRGVGGRKEHGPLAKRARHGGIDTATYESTFRGSSMTRDWEPLMIAFSDCKHLFRRDRLEALGLRFAEDVNFGEDTLFSGTFVVPETLSMVDDYDCYYERLRDDGRNGTTLLAGTEVHLAGVELGLRLQRDRPELRWRAEQHLREALIDLAQHIFNEGFPDRPAPVRERMVRSAAHLLDAWLTPRGLSGLDALDRIKIDLLGRGRQEELCHLIRAVAADGRGTDIVRDGRVYAGYPFFGDPAVGVPDACYDVTRQLAVQHHLASATWDGPRLTLTGHAFLEHVSTWDVRTEVVLRERYGRGEHRVPVQVLPSAWLADPESPYDHGRAGFRVVLDLSEGSSPGAGEWNAIVAVSAQGVTKEAPLGGDRHPGVEETLAACPAPVGGGPEDAVRVAFTKYGTLTLTLPR